MEEQVGRVELRGRALTVELTKRRLLPSRPTRGCTRSGSDRPLQHAQPSTQVHLSDHPVSPKFDPQRGRLEGVLGRRRAHRVLLLRPSPPRPSQSGHTSLTPMDLILPRDPSHLRPTSLQHRTRSRQSSTCSRSRARRTTPARPSSTRNARSSRPSSESSTPCMVSKNTSSP